MKNSITRLVDSLFFFNLKDRKNKSINDLIDIFVFLFQLTLRTQLLKEYIHEFLNQKEYYNIISIKQTDLYRVDKLLNLSNLPFDNFEYTLKDKNPLSSIK